MRLPPCLLAIVPLHVQQRMLSGEEFVECHAQRVLVRWRLHVTGVAPPLGSQIRKRAQFSAAMPALSEDAGQSKIGQTRGAIPLDEHSRWTEIAVRYRLKSQVGGIRLMQIGESRRDAL